MFSLAPLCPSPLTQSFSSSTPPPYSSPPSLPPLPFSIPSVKGKAVSENFVKLNMRTKRYSHQRKKWNKRGWAGRRGGKGGRRRPTC